MVGELGVLHPDLLRSPCARGGVRETMLHPHTGSYGWHDASASSCYESHPLTDLLKHQATCVVFVCVCVCGCVCVCVCDLRLSHTQPCMSMNF